MTLDASLLAALTPFSVGTTASEKVMLAADFTYYSALAKKRLDRDKPSSVDTTTYDMLHAYLVAHIFVSKDPNNTGEFQSESIGGYSYSKKGDIKAGSTYWEQRYLNELLTWGKRSPSAAQTRIDSVLPQEFALDDCINVDTDDGVAAFDGDY